MPTNQTPEDAELSRLLSQAEPPKSPEHLDEAILRYATENAPAADEAEEKTPWFPRPLTAAVATLSVAAVAVSISITSFNSGDLERGSSDFSTSQIASSDAFSPEALVLEEAVSGEDSAESETTSETTPETTRERQVAQNPANSPAPLGATVQLSRANDDIATPAPADDLREEDLREIAALGQALSTERNTSTQDAAPSSIQEEEQTSFAFSSAAQSSVAQELTTATAGQDENLGGRIEADSVLADDPALQSGVASSSPQLALRRAAPTEVRTSAIRLDSSAELVTNEDLPALLSLLEELFNSTFADGELQEEALEIETVSTEDERANQLQNRLTVISDEDELQQLNANYAELRENFADFALPATLEEAIRQLQRLVN